jgi:hypothetical protein
MMQPKELAMSREDYLRMPQGVGGKCEYWDGKARITPRERGATVRLDLPAPGQNAWAPCAVRAVSESDREALVDGFIDAFEGAAEFCGYPVDTFWERAHEDIDDFFEGKRGGPLSASRIVLPRPQQVHKSPRSPRPLQ